MGHLARFVRRLVNVLQPGREDGSLEREIASHLALLEDDYRRRGLSDADARRAARLALGGVEQTRELHRDARSWRWIDNARRDAAYALRMLRRQPVAAASAVLSLALGIGLNAAVFSVVDWVLLRPLPYPAPHELVRVFTAGTSPVTAPSALTYPEFVRFRAASALRDAAAFSTTTRVMAGPGLEPLHVAIARVGGDLFSTLRSNPDVGRAFTADEMSAGAPVVVLSHDFWRRRFAADRAVIGRTVAIDAQPHTIVGVMPAARGYPADADAWRPLRTSEREDDDRELQMIARLQSGVALTRATTELGTLAGVASGGARTAWTDSVQRTDVGAVRTALRALFGAALLTLLIACANVAALVGARVADRAGEMAVRGALGATRGRVLAQIVTESLVLAAAGGALGLLVGRWALTAIVGLAPVSIPRLSEITLDSRVLGAGLAATALAGLAVGLVPALRLSNLAETSGIGRARWQRSTPRSRSRRVLVLAQIAIAVVLTTGAGLLARSLQRLVTIENGFDADRLVSVDLVLRGTFEGDARPLFRQLVAAAESIPGVRAAAVSMRLPTQVIGLCAPVRVVGEPELASPATLRPVGHAYFATVGIPLTAGRSFDASDTADTARVAIVNTTFVRDLLGGRAAAGLRVTTPLVDEPVRIVGVVADVTPAGAADRPALYVPVEQLSIGSGYLVVRAHDDPRAILTALATRLRGVAPNLPLDHVRRVAESLEESRAVTRFSAQVSALFAGLSLVLSLVGVYGLTAGDVAARWRELAVRVALGASRGRALWTVVRPCAVVLFAGLAIGLVAALSVGRAFASLLYGVRPDDVLTLVVAPILMGALGLLAAMIAAMRVLAADPAATLRSE